MLPFNTIVKIKKTNFINGEHQFLIVYVRPVNLLELDEALSKQIGDFVDHSIETRGLLEYCGGYIFPEHNGWIKFTENEIIKDFGIITKEELILNYPEYLF